MSMVILVSGGIDSTVISLLATQQGIMTYPLFIDYGQLSANAEWDACQGVHAQLGLPAPERLDISGIGKLVPSGLTNTKLRLNEDAFLPCRNLFFIVAASSYAFSKGAETVAIGLLDEQKPIFPDQTKPFLLATEEAVQSALGYRIHVVAPLMPLSKAEVMAIARDQGIDGTYSCHSGEKQPCGKCIACSEQQFATG